MTKVSDAPGDLRLLVTTVGQRRDGVMVSVCQGIALTTLRPVAAIRFDNAAIGQSAVVSQPTSVGPKSKLNRLKLSSTALG